MTEKSEIVVKVTADVDEFISGINRAIRAVMKLGDVCDQVASKTNELKIEEGKKDGV